MTTQTRVVTAFSKGEAHARSGFDIGSNPYRGSQIKWREFNQGYQAYQRRTLNLTKECPTP